MNKEQHLKNPSTVTGKMIYIDNWIAEGRDTAEYNKILGYLQIIISAICCKNRWFRGSELKTFVMEASSDILMRIIKPELYVKNKKAEVKEVKYITQIKNYLTICLYGMSIKFRKRNYAPTPKDEEKCDLTALDREKKEVIFTPNYNWFDSELKIHYTDLINSIPKIIKEIALKNTDWDYNILYKNILINLIRIMKNSALNKELKIDKVILYNIEKEQSNKLRLIIIAVTRKLIKEFKELLRDSNSTIEEFYLTSAEDFLGDKHEIEKNQ